MRVRCYALWTVRRLVIGPREPHRTANENALSSALLVPNAPNITAIQKALAGNLPHVENFLPIAAESNAVNL